MRARLWLAGLTVVVVGVVLSTRAAVIPVAPPPGADQTAAAGTFAFLPSTAYVTGMARASTPTTTRACAFTA